MLVVLTATHRHWICLILFQIYTYVVDIYDFSIKRLSNYKRKKNDDFWYMRIKKTLALPYIKAFIDDKSKRLSYISVTDWFKTSLSKSTSLLNNFGYKLENKRKSARFRRLFSSFCHIFPSTFRGERVNEE